MSTESETSHIAMSSSSSSNSVEYFKNENPTFEEAHTLRSQDVEKVNAFTGDGLVMVPPADGGKGAWMFLAGCFVFEALVWGFPFSFGVFQSYYTTHLPFSLSPNGIAAIGTCSSGVMYLVAPITLHVLESWPTIRRLSSIIGLVIAITALLASSFATKVWQLILTQGILYAIGGSMLYSPTMFYLDEWFIKKKGLAFGIMWAGVGAAGLIFPFLLNYLLTSQGHATTLRIWSGILLAFCTPLIYFVKPRLPPKKTPSPRTPISYAFILTRTHLFLQAANILESLGFFLPSIYLPTYTVSLYAHLPSYTGTLLLSLLNLFSVFGAIFLGHLSDRFHIVNVILLSTLGSTLSVFLLWGFAYDLKMLVFFVILYGFFAGGFSALWTGMMKEVRGNGDERAGMGQLMGVFAAGRGIGAVLSGPISEVLLGAMKGRGLGAEDESGGSGFRGRFGVLIVFTGVSAFCGVVALGVKRKSVGDSLDGQGGGDVET